MMNSWMKRPTTLLVVFVAVTVIPLLGNAYLFDWDEVNFAECAREMLVSGDWLHPTIDFAPFWEKPPLFFWLQAAAMKIFGVNEFAARLPNALVGIATVLLLATTGRRWLDDTFGTLWALSWIGSLLPQFYVHSGLIDPLFNLLMFASIVCAVESASNRRRSLWVLLSGISLGLAVLTKGPVALLLVGVPLTIVWLLRYGWRRTLFDGGMIAVVSSLPFVVWLASDRSQYGQWFMQSFIAYQIRLLTTGDAGHSGPIYYHIVVLLLGCLPASWLSLAAVRSRHRIASIEDKSLVMALLFGTVVVVFSIVQTKIVHYSSLAYFPLTYFAAHVLYHLWREDNRHWALVVGILGSCLLGIAMVATPIVLGNRELLLRIVRDDFARSIVETTAARWAGIEWAPGALILLAVGTAIVLTVRRLPRAAFVVVLVGNALGISAFLRVVAPRIQDFTQRRLVEFCKAYANRDVILHPIGFKTYVHLFYGKRRIEQSPRGLGIQPAQWESYLLDGHPPFDVVFIAKRTKASDLLRRHDLVQLDDPNSPWLFLLRPRTTSNGSTF
jgi:4-amino-4-deoxy-L-arabinose transferase-like glycosyltransferase